MERRGTVQNSEHHWKLPGLAHHWMLEHGRSRIAALETPVALAMQPPPVVELHGGELHVAVLHVVQLRAAVLPVAGLHVAGLHAVQPHVALLRVVQLQGALPVAFPAPFAQLAAGLHAAVPPAAQLHAAQLPVAVLHALVLLAPVLLVEKRCPARAR